MYEVAIIGGGASGLAAAITAKARGKNVVLLESSDRVGKKILATGNGKCNLSNAVINVYNYNNSYIAPFLQQSDKFYNFFENLGLKLKQVEDRIYPYSESATTVLNLLRDKLSDEEIKCGCNIESIEKKQEYFVINGEILAEKVILATGSNATSGINSHHLATKLGHKVSSLKPSLVPLVTDVTYIKKLKNLRAKVLISLIKDEKVVDVQNGEILFKDNGISGIAVFMLSSYLARNKGDYKVSIDFTPDLTNEELSKFLKNHSVFGLLHKAIAESVVFQATSLKKEVEHVIKNFIIEKVNLGPAKFAQVTNGGLATSEFDENLQSRLVKNFYACGEVLDIDGDCGGYNLYWAFISGIIAGENV